MGIFGFFKREAPRPGIKHRRKRASKAEMAARRVRQLEDEMKLLRAEREYEELKNGKSSDPFEVLTSQLDQANKITRLLGRKNDPSPVVDILSSPAGPALLQALGPVLISFFTPKGAQPPPAPQYQISRPDPEPTTAAPAPVAAETPTPTYQGVIAEPAPARAMPQGEPAVEQDPSTAQLIQILDGKTPAEAAEQICANQHPDIIALVATLRKLPEMFLANFLDSMATLQPKLAGANAWLQDPARWAWTQELHREIKARPAVMAKPTDAAF